MGIYRYCILTNSEVCLCNLEKILTEDTITRRIFIMEFFSFLQKYFLCIFVITEEDVFWDDFIPQTLHVLHFKTTTASYEEQVAFWKKITASMNLDKTINFNLIANRFNFSIGQIKKAVALSKTIAQLENKELVSQIIFEKGCETSCSHLQELGTHLVQKNYTWNDLVLNRVQKKNLLHACNHVKLNHIVYENWNFKIVMNKHTYANNNRHTQK